MSRREPRVDFDKLAKEILSESTSAVVSYAPPKFREDQQLLVKQIETFGQLPTKELDEIVTAAENQLARLKDEAQVIRDMYVKHTTRVAADIKRLQEGIKLSLETMKNLREQCAQLDGPEAQEPQEELPLPFPSLEDKT